MKLHVRVNGKERAVELAPGKLILDGEPAREVSVEMAEAGFYSVLLDGRSYDVRAEEGVVTVCGHRFEVEVRDPRRWNRASASGGQGGVQQVFAPMPGKVVRVLVAAGDAVEEGQGIVVVEAMKMQNEMKASRAGTIGSLTAQVGATVTAGEVLATII